MGMKVSPGNQCERTTDVVVYIGVARRLITVPRSLHVDCFFAISTRYVHVNTGRSYVRLLVLYLSRLHTVLYSLL
jgi:hypothetical protein